jgi:hypothetical protein
MELGFVTGAGRIRCRFEKVGVRCNDSLNHLELPRKFDVTDLLMRCVDERDRAIYSVDMSAR